MPRTVPGIKLVLLHGWTNGWVDGRLILTHGSENSGYWLRPWSRLHTTLCPTPTPSTPDSHPAVFFLCFIAMYTFWQQIIDLLVLFIACLSSLEFKPHKGGTFACFAHYHCLMQCENTVPNMYVQCLNVTLPIWVFLEPDLMCVLVLSLFSFSCERSAFRKIHPWWLRQQRIHQQCRRPGFNP